MAVRYFINRTTLRAKLLHGHAAARQAEADGFTEVTSEQFEVFRCESREIFRAMVLA